MPAVGLPRRIQGVAADVVFSGPAMGIEVVDRGGMLGFRYNLH
jgi:hypothetical protein